MGIIVNFSARTVQGFVSPGFEFPAMITAANDVMVAFSGQQQLRSSVHSIFGSIDRVTGDVEATSSIADPKTSKSISQTAYVTVQANAAHVLTWQDGGKRQGRMTERIRCRTLMQQLRR